MEPSQTVPPKGQEPKEFQSTLSVHRIMLKAKYSFYSAVVFFLFANPETARVFQRFFGSTVTFLSNGALTMTGMFIQTVLFFVTMLSLMLLPIDG
jgi:hypothetical protein